MTDPDELQSEVSTRDYQTQDAPALAALFRAAILETGPAAYTAEQCAAWAASADDAEAWAQRLQDNWVRVAVDEEGEIAGFGAIRMPGHIDLIFTAPDYNRQGVGSLILEDLLELAAAMGAKQLTTTASEIARPFFEKHGFRVQESGAHERCGQMLACHAMVRGKA